MVFLSRFCDNELHRSELHMFKFIVFVVRSHFMSIWIKILLYITIVGCKSMHSQDKDRVILLRSGHGDLTPVYTFFSILPRNSPAAFILYIHIMTRPIGDERGLRKIILNR